MTTVVCCCFARFAGDIVSSIGVGSIRRLEPEVEGREGSSAVKSGVGLSIAFPLPFALVRDQPQDA